MRWHKALGGLIALTAVVVGPPAALIGFVGNPYPPGGITLDFITNREIIGFLAAIGWLLWAQFMVCIAAEIISVISGREFRVPGTIGQGLARRLVGACVVVSAAAPVLMGGAASAAEPAHVGHSTVAVAQHVAGHPQTTKARQSVGTTTVTVKPYDTLMGIAEHHLGSITEWKAIANLNEGRVMNDGTVFRSADQIRPGWELLVPASAQASTEHTVAPGESLSQIAQEDLGNADQWPALYDANKTVIGSDPNLIQPGQHLQMPGHAESEQTPAPEISAPAPHANAPKVALPTPRHEAKPETPTSTHAAEVAPAHRAPAAPVTQTPEHAAASPGAELVAPSGSASSTTSTGSTDETSNATDHAQVASDDSAWPIRTIGGAGAILAAAVVGLLAARRSRQQRRRPPGVRMPLPSAEAEVVEQEVRQVADPVGMETIDVALRALAAGAGTPALRAVRMSPDQVDVYLTESVDLEAPWRAGDEDRTTWFISGDDASTLHFDDAADAPYPALVSIGHDEDGAVILLNLAATGGIGITGDVEHTGEALTAMVLELASTPWSHSADLTVVGAMAELADELRFRYVPAFVASPDAGLLAEFARQGENPQRIVASRMPLDDERREALRAFDVAVVAQDAASEWALQITDRDHAILLPLGIEVTPQLVDQRTYAGLLESLNVAMVDPRSITEEQGSLVVPFDEVGEGPDHDAAPAVTVGGGFAAFDNLSVNSAVDQVDELETVGDVPPEEVTPAAAELDAQADPDTAAAELPAVEEPIAIDSNVQADDQDAAETELPALLETGHPVVRILGEKVQIIGLAGEAPSSETHRGVCTRIAAFWALNPGASRESMIHAVWGGKAVSPSTVDPRVSNVRKWFGSNPLDGAKYLPDRKTQFVDEVTTDWAIFNQLIGPDPAKASTENLEQALNLVTGRPFRGEADRDYAWAEYLRSDVDDTIADVAYHLGRRRYFEGAWRKAAAAVSTGILIQPGNEWLWRLQLHIANSEGRHGAVAEAIDRMKASIQEISDDIDFDPETVELIEALQSKDAGAIEQHREAL